MEDAVNGIHGAHVALSVWCPTIYMGVVWFQMVKLASEMVEEHGYVYINDTKHWIALYGH